MQLQVLHREPDEDYEYVMNWFFKISQLGARSKLINLRNIFLILILILLNIATANAEDATDDVVQLDEIIVEGSLIEDTVFGTPKGVSVITEVDIEQNPGKSVIDLISTKTGTNLTSYTGSTKQSTVDLRGMGATAGNNVLVIVDGIRLNAPDLSGADLFLIDLDAVEKIEIIRGPETVVYGDGAVGGVISITTRKGKKRPTLSVKGLLGSYETGKASVRFSGGGDTLDYKLDLSHIDSDGYRDNGFYRKSSAGLNLEHSLTGNLTLLFSSAVLKDAYGLPGPVSLEELESDEKRIETDNPEDYGETKDGRVIGGFEWKLGSKGTIKAKQGIRFRENRFLLGYSPVSGMSKEQQMGFIDEQSETTNISFSQPYSNGKVSLGMDYFHSYYIREANAQKERHNSRTDNIGLFATNQWHISDDFKWNIGLRTSTFRGEFRKDAGTWDAASDSMIWKNGDLIEKEWSNQAYSTGIVYRLNDTLNLFLSSASSFRTPNVDEFALADSDLKPQTGTNVEGGLRRNDPGDLGFSIILFQMINQDEIYYGTDPDSGRAVNRNYEETTVRRGLEAEFDYFPNDLLYIRGNTSLLDARFSGSGNVIPLVPDTRVNLGVEINATNRLVFALSGSYTGERFDGNDESNSRYRKLEAYSVVNAKAGYTFKQDRKLSCGVNNLFDEHYSTIAYSETYYPMPTRNYYCELSFTL